MSLEPVLKTAIDNLRSGRLEREEHVKQAVILPILQALGWNPADLGSIVPEYPAGPGRVDYALLRYRRPQVFVEAKRRGALDVRAEAQLFGYARDNGVPLLVLTDGDCWDFYLSMADGLPEDRRFQSLKLRREEEIPEYAEALETALGRQDVASGEARRTAERRLESSRERARAGEAIPEVWNALLNEPDEFLRDLVAERVHDKIGVKPELSDVEDFLKKLTSAPLHPATARRPPIRQSDPPSGEAQPNVTGDGSEPKSGSFDDRRRGTARGGDFQAIVYDLMRSVLETHPGLLDEETISYLEKEKNPFGTRLPHPLIRKKSEGVQVSGHNRYKNEVYAGRWYVCSQWWKDNHSHNAMKLAEWVKSLTDRANSPEARNRLESILGRLSSWEEKRTP